MPTNKESFENMLFVNISSPFWQVVVYYDLRPMYYGRYRDSAGSLSEDEEVLHYAQLVGRKCARRMLLLR